MVNIMRDIPRVDTQEVAHCRLLLCMFLPFFNLDDLKSNDESWPHAMRRVDETNAWDKRTKPFRLNIAAMLRQRIAADEERAKKVHQAFMLTTDRDVDNHTESEMFLDDYGNSHDMDSGGISVIPQTAHRLLTKIFVDTAYDTFVHAGFSGDDSSPTTPNASLSRRSTKDIEQDLSKITGSSGASSKKETAQQEHAFETMSSSQATYLADSTSTSPTPTPSAQCDRSVLDPYLIHLRSTSSAGLSPSALLASNDRRDRTNAEVARTDVGQAAASQHPVSFLIAQEFGLNRKQRLAFYIFANGMLAKKTSPRSDALRLYIGGGAGAGKSHVLKAMKAFIECPALVGQIEDGRMLAVAFQGKQAAAVGGVTIHSTCQSSAVASEGNLSGNHDDQSPLTDKQAIHWKGVGMLAIEEVSMVGCELLVALNKAACSMFAMNKDKPFGNLPVVFCGDFNQLRLAYARYMT